MKIISHRGYLDGENEIQENNPIYIDECLSNGFDVEVDLRLNSNKFYLGHDIEKYIISIDWILERKEFLWVHCKDIYSIQYLIESELDINYFWHENDLFTITSKNYLWAYPNKKVYQKAVNVLPEKNWGFKKIVEEQIFAICTDYPKKYRGIYK